MRILIALAFLVIVGLVLAVIYLTVDRRKYRDIVEGRDDPLVFLTRRERRAWARDAVLQERGRRIDDFYQKLLDKNSRGTE